MTPDDDWHPVGLSNAIEAGHSAGTHLFGRELLLWRDSSGIAHIGEDRCPHRGMKLSFGFVRGDHIACLYHGWQFDHSGACRYIPAHPELQVPDTIRVPVYPVLERGSMIWTTLSAPPPARFDADEPAVPLRSIHVDSSVETALEVFGDPQLRPFASPAPTILQRVTATLYTLSAGADRLMIGIQRMSPDRIGLHVACRLAGPNDGPVHRQLLGWVVRVRHAIEQARLSNTANGGAEPCT